ncbi:sensor histidine kinase [Microbacteriaceae bacterium VKM Ac-2854]|nr:sensor histidine kinase [Microbacteriaceae bacterium VKM Ac-2854]
MAHSPLTPVFTGLRTGLTVLFLVLVVLVIGRAVLTPSASSGVIVALSLVLTVTFAAGSALARARARRRVRLLWLCALTAEWAALLWLSPEAAYLVFPLFFLYLLLLGPRWGSAALVAATATAIIALGLHGGFSVGGVVGPLVGAGVALLIGLGYRSLAREAQQREALLLELTDTRDQLAATERASGVLAERARLAREIHDTVAQGLASIQLLLHAAERADPQRPGIEHLRLARETAGASLADTRRFISELSPPELDERGLGAALQRIASTRWAAEGLTVEVRVADPVPLPMHIQTALLRIAQGAIANVIQHAQARNATIALAVNGESLRFTVSDDGRGFDPALGVGGGRSDSFGLRATRERVEQLGGTVTLDSRPQQGSTLRVDLSIGDAA